ncbi:MAG: hypothetical protein IJ154_08410 [Bacteroidales bacterium]|nr:hypothetical protein [Bacteroidales bacterium]
MPQTLLFRPQTPNRRRIRVEWGAFESTSESSATGGNRGFGQPWQEETLLDSVPVR